MKERKVADDITDALFELLKTKNLVDITTTEIIKKAGVCRSSFYRNFYLPEDVIRQFGVTMFKEIDRMTPIDYEGMEEHVLLVNTYLWSQKERLSILEKRKLFYLLEEPISEHCMHQIHRLGITTYRYQAEFCVGATIQLIRAWIHNGFEESPQEITELTCKLFKLNQLIEPHLFLRTDSPASN